MKKNGYEKLLRKVLEILEDNPQDIVDEDEGAKIFLDIIVFNKVLQ